MPKQTYSEHIAHIKNAHKEDRLAIFVGAGFSKVMNDDYPSWSDIIEGLKVAMPGINEFDVLKIAEHYKLEFGHIETKSKVKSYFPVEDMPSPLHKQLIELYPNFIITTNWDKIFEASLKETSSLYDVIVDDKDLSTSSLAYRIIKMHGDFDKDNFVFTESDYLNYAYNFPLIESYLKGIFTTHTVVFLGYGFGDIDLKLIMNWLKNNSAYIRPRYMLIADSKYNEYSEKYYNEFNITLLPKKTQSNSSHLFYAEYSEFIDEINSDSEEKMCDEVSPLDYVNLRLKSLEKLNLIIFNQIQNLLTNCSVMITLNGPVLWFFHKIKTYDYDVYKRGLYKEFCEIFYKFVKETNKELFSKKEQACFNKLINIFQKSGIVGIYFGDNNTSEDYCIFDGTSAYNNSNLLDTISFNYDAIDDFSHNDDIPMLIYKSYCYYSLFLYVEAFNLCEQALKLILKSRRFDFYFIALWNYNAILFELKNNYFPVEKISRDKLLEWKNPYEKIVKKDLEKEFSRLPRTLREKYKEIYKITTWDFILANNVKSQKRLTDVRKKAKLIAKGGFSHSNQYPTDQYFHGNILFTALSNHILVEKNQEFANMCKNYCEISFIRNQINNNENYSFSIQEIYSYVKYFHTEDLNALFSDLYEKLSDKKAQYTLDESQQLLIIDAIFSNCARYYKKTLSIHAHQAFNTYLCNSLSILSYADVKSELLVNILDKINQFIAESSCMIDFFTSVNRFIAVQYNLYYHDASDRKFPSANSLNIYTTFLNKFTLGQTNGFEYEAIKNNSLQNITYLSKITNNLFTDNELLRKVSIKIGLYDDTNEKRRLILSILLSIYHIADDNCKEIIKSFISEQSLSVEQKNSFDFNIFIYDLWLDYNNIVNISLEQLENYIALLKQEDIIKDVYVNIWIDALPPLQGIIDSKNACHIQNMDQYSELHKLVGALKNKTVSIFQNMPSYI